MNYQSDSKIFLKFIKIKTQLKDQQKILDLQNQIY